MDGCLHSRHIHLIFMAQLASQNPHRLTRSIYKLTGAHSRRSRAHLHGLQESLRRLHRAEVWQVVQEDAEADRRVRVEGLRMHHPISSSLKLICCEEA